MQITKELFAVPYGGRTFLYAPLEGSVLEVQPGVIGFLNRVQNGEDPTTLNSALTEKLRELNIFVDKQGVLPGKSSCNSGYAPTSVTLLPTYNCNLRCVYCYSRGGEEIGKVMGSDIARASIDFIVDNARKTRHKKVSLGFHGGGEPLLPGNMDLVKYSVDYFNDQVKRSGLKGNVHCASNGVFLEDTLEWVVNNMSRLSLSLDGPEDIQNAQRPFVGNAPSFNRIVSTIQGLENLPAEIKKRFSYGLRATITATSVERMPEILSFFSSISRNDSFHLEPLFECGRCNTTNAASPSPERFVAKMIETLKLGRELGRKIYYSAAELGKLGETFCGACGSNFFVTPEGYVTTCLEACRPNEKPAEVFFIGKYDPEAKKFEFDQHKRSALSERKVSNMPHCTDCFAKYNCSGDCPAKVFEESGNLNDPSNNRRCSINQGLLAYKLAERLDEEKDKTARIESKPRVAKDC